MGDARGAAGRHYWRGGFCFGQQGNVVLTVIGLRSIDKFYGGRAVLRGLDLSVAPGARIGLVGGNGAGKSTLLRLLAGLEEPDGGEVVRRRGLRVAFLPQYVECGVHTPMEVLRAARPELAEVRRDLEACEERLGEPEVTSDLRRMERVLERHGRLLERFTELGGNGFDGEARGRLTELGFDRDDVDRPMDELSGGQRKLAVLGACLMGLPDILLLDEPESHLDSGRRERLEAIVRSFDGAVVTVSHDRYLLDETATEIVELENGKSRVWPGNYSAYALARELEQKRQQQLYVTQQKEIARLEEAIRRFKQWAHNTEDERHARQARVKRRQIESMDKVEKPVLERRRIGLSFREGVRGGQKVVELREVGVAFGEETVLIGAELTVSRGERVGVVGPNGAGKSVLAKVLAGELAPTEGTRWIGPSINTGYLPQDHAPAPGATPLSLVRDTKPIYEGDAVNLLGRFLFRYEQARSPVDSLSGGERTRLEFLLLMLKEPNFLVLDEPTNHLDIASMEVLEGELERFPGTVVFVSHDRYFLDRLADRIVEVRGGDLRSYPGGYSDWQLAAGRHARFAG